MPRLTLPAGWRLRLPEGLRSKLSKNLRLPSWAPTPEEVLGLWREWRCKKRPIVLRPYVDLHTKWRLAAKFMLPIGIGFFCLVYGFYFALTAPYLVVPMAVPIAIIGLLAIWALPEDNIVPTRAMEFTFVALIVGLILWPNYLALSLPGLPWITMVRLTGFPMGFFLLFSLSVSPAMRQEIGSTAKSTPLILRIFAIFSINQFISLPFSHSIADSINKVVLQQLNWTAVFFVSIYIFRHPNRSRRYLAMLLAMVVATIILAVLEAQEQKVLWSGHVPSFLRVEDPSAQLALSNAVRGATGLYRVKGTFSTPLGLSEYAALMTPFAIHWAVSSRGPVVKLLSLALVPILYFTVRLTDARLGVAGYLVSVLVYLLLWSLVRWRQRMGDLLTAAIVYAYPAMFLVAVAATMFVHKIHVLVFGGGAQAASNAARGNQFRMAWPALLKNPIGHGAGQSGLAMGYGAGSFIAIDSYYINISLDYGVIGLITYVSIFAVIIHSSIKTLLTAKLNDREVLYLIPLSTCLCAFLVVRGVFGQPDIHPLIFMLVGMSVALVARAQKAKPVSSSHAERA